MMTTSVNDTSYNRKRQRLLSNSSSKPVTVPKKQHHSDSMVLNSEVINLDSEDEDYIFNNTKEYPQQDGIHSDPIDDNMAGLKSHVDVSFDTSYNRSEYSNNELNYPNSNNVDPFATQENFNSGNLNIHNNHNSSQPYLNISASSIDSGNNGSNDVDSNNYYNFNYECEYNTIMEDPNNDEVIIDEDDDGDEDNDNGGSGDDENNLDNENLDRIDIVGSDSNVDDMGSYNDYVNNYMKPQTRHLSFTRPLSIFKRFSKKSVSGASTNTGSSSGWGSGKSNNSTFPTKSKMRTKSLPQLSYSKLTYSPALDQEEVSLKIGDIKASLINHTNYTYALKNEMNRNKINNFRKFSFQNANRLDQTSQTSTQAFSNSNNSTETSSYDDKYINQNDLKLINYKTDEEMQENEVCDDDDGYYIVKNGSPFANGRFTIKKLLGQGTFGKVVKAYDHQTNSDVAIKIIKSIKKYREASKIELRVLTMLKKHDPTNKFQCIHLRECFDYRDHICIVTDLLKISLYDFMEKNAFLPLPGSHIQAMVKQLLRSVAFMHDLKLIHTDLKPENILIKDASYRKKPYLKPEDGETYFRKILKDPKIYTIDFGSAIFQDEYHSSIISTRHYRAPEIILGVGWSFPCDIWSIGSIMIELLTGEALFKTHENPQHLAMMEKIIGKHVDINMVRQCLNMYSKKNTPSSSRFDATIINSFSRKTGHLIFGNRTNDSSLVADVEKMKTIEALVEEKIGMHFDMSLTCKESIKKFKIANDLKDTYTFWYYYIELIKMMLVFNPNDRITAKDALNHKWFDLGIYDDGVDS